MNGTARIKAQVRRATLPSYNREWVGECSSLKEARESE